MKLEQPERSTRAGLTPKEARELFRAGLSVPTAGYSAGYAQANLIIVPKDLAFDVLLFAQRNPKSCPILGVLEAGQTSNELLVDGDIRTDLPSTRSMKTARRLPNRQISPNTGGMIW